MEDFQSPDKLGRVEPVPSNPASAREEGLSPSVRSSEREKKRGDVDGGRNGIPTSFFFEPPNRRLVFFWLSFTRTPLGLLGVERSTPLREALPRGGMGSVMMDRVETRTTESMAEMAERMSKELRAEMHNSEVQLSHWVAEREQRLGDVQVSMGIGNLLLFCRGAVVLCSQRSFLACFVEPG